MNHANIHEALHYNNETIEMDVLLETPFVRELRIAMYAHQVMRDHESDHPVTIEVIEGAVTLSTETQEIILPKGEIVVLEGGVKHHVEAIQESLLRLSIITAVDESAGQ